jgi:copper chaperone CopZ
MTLLTRRAALIVLCGLLVLGGLVSIAATALAQAPVTYTTIRVQNMHCDACAKKIARRLYTVPGVVEVRADVAKNIAYVVPQKDKSLSPRTLWESVEAAGFKVARLDGPQGAFTTKPMR